MKTAEAVGLVEQARIAEAEAQRLLSQVKTAAGEAGAGKLSLLQHPI